MVSATVAPGPPGPQGEPPCDSRSRNAAELDRLAVTLRPSLLAAARAVAEEEDAEDMVGRTFLRACAGLDSYDPNRGTMADWIAGIHRNTIRDWLRVAKRRRACEALSMDALDEEERQAMLARCTPPSDPLMVADWRLRLRYTRLTEEESACLYLRREGNTEKAISRLTGLHISTVHRRLAAAALRLAACPVESLASTDVDWYLFLALCRIYQYHPPQKTGSGLARERLAVLEREDARIVARIAKRGIVSVPPVSGG